MTKRVTHATLPAECSPRSNGVHVGKKKKKNLRVRNEEYAESALFRRDKVRRSDDVGHEFFMSGDAN